MNYIRFIVMSCVLALLLACPKPTEPATTEAPTEPQQETHKNAWTIMVYLDGDNDLESAGVEDFNEMERGLYLAQQRIPAIADKLNIIVLFDRRSGEWTDTRLYKILPDNTMSSMASQLITSDNNLKGELNMGNPATLSNFITYCKAQYPNTNYMLVLWNHGGGARSPGTTKLSSGTKAVCWDDSSANDALYTDEIQQVLATHFSPSSKLDILGFDACLMGMVEVACEFRNLARYMVASMHTEQGDGWDYEYIIQKFAQGSASNYSGSSSFSFTAGNPSPRDLAKLIVYAYEHYIEDSENRSNDSGETLSAIDLDNTKMEALKAAIFALAGALDAESKQSSIESDRDDAVNYFGSTLAQNDQQGNEISYPFFDLYDFCYIIANDTNTRGYRDGLKNAAAAVITKLHDVFVWAYGDRGGYRGPFRDGTGYYFGTDKSGLSIFFSRGNITYNGFSHYGYQWWYTSADTASTLGTEYLYGNIDFCTYNTNVTVDTWRELMNKWYQSSWGY